MYSVEYYFTLVQPCDIWLFFILLQQPDDAAVPAGGTRDAMGVLYPPHFVQDLVCPICKRTDFKDIAALEMHAAYCDGSR